jgi:hypothetical protein
MSIRKADVVIRKRPTVVPEDDRHPIAGGLWSLTVNGVEMAHQIVANGVHIEFPAETPGLALVTLRFRADVDLDLPDSAVEHSIFGVPEVIVP